MKSFQEIEKTISVFPLDGKLNSKIKTLILKVIKALDQGELRVATSSQQGWKTHEWIKKSILLYFRIQKIKPIKAGELKFFDKIPLKKWSAKESVRVVPHALARFGSFVEPGSVLMPSYINIGAYVGAGTMIDTWATVGSCAQIGSHCHLSGGVGIGGVLEPLQAQPVIIEDNVFIGSRAIIVEGVLVKRGAVIGAGVVLTASTPIIDVSSAQAKMSKGLIPENSVVIPGTRPKVFPAGTYHTSCALIIGQRKESTDKKTSLNQVLRDFEISL
ncbi:MAG: 2,3,4,5-tetrahydropyridine-2,6-dicarboxylate N-succinyltransferase [Pseudomonadota bacterium]|nr:2,3,4,5-tetrahydropyridine-2,6-dicarboxylate N-succinyltransferase [Pseudomonadota bacterium]